MNFDLGVFKCEINFNHILNNNIILSIIGGIISIIFLLIYKCVCINNTITKYTYLQIFISHFLIIYIILNIYSNNNINIEIDNTDISTTNNPLLNA